MSYKSLPYIFNSLPDVDKQILAWCYNNNKTYIDGNKIYTGTINADKINVNKLSSLSANLGDITGGSLNINNKFIVDADGNATVDGKVTARSGKIGGFDLDENTMSSTVTKTFNYSQSDLDAIKNIIMDGTTQSAELLAKYDINCDGYISSMDYVLIKNILEAGNQITTSFKLKPNYLISNHNEPIFEIQNNRYGRTWIDQLGYLYSKKGTFDNLYIGNDSIENLFSQIGAKENEALDVLWSGSEMTPSFDIDNIDDYKYFLIRCGSSSSTYYTWIFCPYTTYANIGLIRGIGGFETDSGTNGGEIYFVRGTHKNGTFSIEYACYRTTATMTTNNKTVQLYVKDIVGVK